MHLIKRWTAGQGSLSSLQKYGKNILQNIQILNISWCKCISYTGGKFGGWVSENYLAMSRINVWFYSMIHTLPRDDIYKGDPITPPSKWTKKQNLK